MDRRYKLINPETYTKFLDLYTIKINIFNSTNSIADKIALLNNRLYSGDADEDTTTLENKLSELRVIYSSLLTIANAVQIQIEEILSNLKTELPPNYKDWLNSTLSKYNVTIPVIKNDPIDTREEINVYDPRELVIDYMVETWNNAKI